MFQFLKRNKNITKKTFAIEGMHCASCAALIESELEDVGYTAKCSYAKQIIEIVDNGTIDEKKIKKAVTSAGYKLQSVSSSGS